MAADVERRRFNVGCVKLPPELRDVAHAVITADDDRGFLNIIGAADQPTATPDGDPQDHTLPVGANVTYSVELTDAEAEAFRTASNCRYIELDVRDSADGVADFPSASSLEFMRARFPEAGAQWHGRDVTVAVLDGGTTAAVRAYMGWTLVGRGEFSVDPVGSDEITANHGCLVAPCAVPPGGRLLDVVVSDDDNTTQRVNAATGIRWAVDQGAQILNLSFSGATPDNGTYSDAFTYATARGAQLFVSMGNDNLNQMYTPANLSTTYAGVHSSISFDTATGARSTFSNYHSSASGCAPGTLVLGLDPAGTPVQWNGTSASSPHMAQLAARLCTGERFTAAQAGAALKANTRDTGQSVDQQGGGAYSLQAALTALGGFSDGATRTNRAVNPALANNATNWFSSGTGTRVTGLTGLPRTTGYQATTQFITPQFSVTAGQTYTTSTALRNTTAATITVSFDWYASGVYLSGSGSVTYTVQAGGVQRIARTAVAPATATTGLMKVSTSAGTMTATAHLVEQAGAVGTYFDGASTDGAWSGTAGNSTSTRAFPVPTPATRRNLATNPSLETATTGTSVATRSGITATAPGRSQTLVTPVGAWYGFTNITGDGSTSTSADVEVTVATVDVTAGTGYVFSSHCRHQIYAVTVQLQVTWRNAGGTTLSTSVSDQARVLWNEWVRYALTATAPANATSAVLKLLVRGATDTTVRSFRWDGVQVEAASSLGDYFDGSTSNSQWDGTAHASTSTYASATQVVSPTGIPSGEAFGTPVVSLPDLIVSPVGIESAEAFGTPVVGANQIVTPAGIVSAEAVGAPALTVGSPPQTVAPVGIDSAEAFGLPVVAPDQLVQPTGIASAEVFGSPTIAPDQLVQPTGIPSAEAFGVPEVFAAPVPINPDLRVDFWAVADSGYLLCPLPHPVAWDLALVPGEPGAVSIEYPVDGLNFDVLDQRVTRKRDLRIKIRYDGTDATAYGAILHARDGDQVAEGGTVKFIGRFLTWLLAEAPLAYNGSSEKGEWLYPDGTAGSILADVLDVVQADHFLTSLTWTFTDTVDSNGAPWTLQTSAKFPPGRTVLQVAQQLRQWGMVEFEVVDLPGVGLELRAYQPDAIGTDHTVGDRPLVLRAGRDLTDAPRRMDVSAAATTLLVAGADGVYAEVDSSTARAERGRKIGQYVSQGQLTTHGSAVAYGTLELARRVEGVDELTHSLTFDQDARLPLRDYITLDWVYTDTGDGTGIGQRERIAQITISQPKGADGYRGGVVLRDLIDSRDLALARRLDGLAGGQIVTGVSQPSPPVDDGIPPVAPTGLSAESAAYYDGATPLATVTATWLPVNDPTLDGYEVQWRYQTGQALPTSWQVAGRTRDTTMSWSALVAGAAIDVRVAAFDRFTRVSAWSDVFSLTTGADATPPPVPSTPDAASYLGILTVAWDGLGSAGERMPVDFSHVEVHASTTSSFTPDRPLTSAGRLDEAASTTYLDRLSGAGTMPSTVGEYGDTWYARLVAVDKTGNASTASAQDSALLEPAKDGDIGAVSIGKLTAGIMSALMTISGIIRTAASGARVELDTTGLRCYSSTGAVLFEFSIPTSALSMVGKLTSGVGIGAGRTIVIDPTGDTSTQPAILFYPNATAQRIRLRALSDATPDGGSAPQFGLEVLNSSGTPDGGVLNVWDGGAALYTHVGAGTGPNGGVVYAGETQAYIGNDDGIVAINDGGGVVIDGPAGVFIDADSGQTIRFGLPVGGSSGFSFRLDTGGTAGVRAVMGSSFMGFANNSGNTYMKLGDGGGAYKNFVLPHPTDPDRYLVHACVEGPEAAVFHRGVATLVDGQAVVELPAYFEASTLVEGRTVQVTMLLPDEPVEVLADVPPPPPVRVPFLPPPEEAPAPLPEHLLVRPAAASLPRDGRFRIACPAPDGTRVSWEVKAVRADGPPLVAEPLRSDVEVGGLGPYTFVTGRETRD